MEARMEARMEATLEARQLKKKKNIWRIQHLLKQMEARLQDKPSQQPFGGEKARSRTAPGSSAARGVAPAAAGAWSSWVWGWLWPPAPASPGA